ncbi:hypothetical protein [Actinomyces mediterranea]|uniref:hypothetical protein n=1 Tax=Actinomyces mediterranea TaxID=1871028 RepID=UPI000970599B|nr:hypothetical protein [Actinomyces mediterranea]
MESTTNKLSVSDAQTEDTQLDELITRVVPPTIDFTARSRPHWLIWLVLVIGGAVVVGVLLARLFNVGLVPPIPSADIKKRR